MFKPKHYPVDSGTIYQFPFKQPIYVPDKLGLTVEEARDLNNLLGTAQEDVKVLRAAVYELAKLHTALRNVDFQVNAIRPLEMDFRMEALWSAFKSVGYVLDGTDQGYYSTELRQPLVIKEIIEEVHYAKED
jgi:hypothetical protein